MKKEEPGALGARDKYNLLFNLKIKAIGPTGGNRLEGHRGWVSLHLIG